MKRKNREKLEFTPTFFWEDMTYVLQLIGKFFKWLIAKISGSDEEVTEEADGE